MNQAYFKENFQLTHPIHTECNGRVKVESYEITPKVYNNLLDCGPVFSRRGVYRMVLEMLPPVFVDFENVISDIIKMKDEHDLIHVYTIYDAYYNVYSMFILKYVCEDTFIAYFG